MKRKMKRILSFLVALALCVVYLPITTSAAQSVTRIYGENRYETAFAAADALKETLGIEKFGAVVVASGKSFADALAGSYLAAVRKAPILLSSDRQADALKSYIDANLSENGTVYLLGGTSAISEAVEEAMSGHTVKRLAGENRYETNLQILNEAGVGSQEILVCTGKSFADSLSASAVGKPILLVSKGLTEGQKAVLSGSSGKFVIIGGESAVSESIETALNAYGTVERVGGENRYETSVKVAERFFETPQTAVLAYARNFPDGLCGGPLAYAQNAPLLLTKTGSEAAADAYTEEMGIRSGTVLGGEGLISDQACSEIFSAAASDDENGKDNQEEPYAFPAGDFITTSDISIDAGTLMFDIGENVYVPGHLKAASETLTAAIEKVTGLDFDGAGYGRENYPDGKVHVYTSRRLLYAGEDWYDGLDSSELGSAWASGSGHAYVSPGDLYFGNTYAIAHEISHMLMFREEMWQNSQLLDEGFAEYTSYRALLELEKTDPETAYYHDRPELCIWNMHISDYEKLYEHPLEYWFENTFEYSGNANYSIGFRFMWYLNEVYGDYGKWITEMEKQFPYSVYGGNLLKSTVDMQLEVLKLAYGEDVLDNFYPWLKQNEALFDSDWDTAYWDISGVDGINLYPEFNSGESVVRLERIEYEDLYINIETTRKYLSEYKGIDASALTIFNPDKLTINLYQADGSYTTVTGEMKISLDGISYIKLVGKGKLNTLQIVGFDA